MVSRRAPPAPSPGKQDIIRFIEENPNASGKREIARAFHLNAAQKLDLKKVLRDLVLDGTIQRGSGRKYTQPGILPNVCVVEVTGTDRDGDVIARPVSWDSDDPPPIVYMAPERRGQPAPGSGDRSLARVERAKRTKSGKPDIYNGKTIRRLTATPARIIGLLVDDDTHLRLRPTDRRAKSEFLIDKHNAGDAGPGDLVRAEILSGNRLGLRFAKVVERLDNMNAPGAASLISIHEHDLPTEFSAEALEQASSAGPAPLEGRVDLRSVPFVTIDGDDARDFDDAVFAEPDTAENNKDGWHVIVAIADVAWYVGADSALDRDAYRRGNSVYFPDRVVPMLPEALSNGWCSLVPHEERPCLAAHMWIDEKGHLKRHRFERAIMCSHARLTYHQAQAAFDGHLDDSTQELEPSIIENLFKAFAVLEAARKKRGALELDLPERQVVINNKGVVEDIFIRERLASHRLIEEFMITANVAAAETLEKHNQPCLYRVHDQPGMEKIEALRDFLDSMDIPFARGGVIRAESFNTILSKVADTPQSDLVNTVILRSQSQAAYHPENIGHFGLNLRRYSHFTSPIRRYADLMVHRALITGCKLGDDGLKPDHRDFEDIGSHLSVTERRAATAERDAIDRFTASFVSTLVGQTFTAHVSGVTRFGLFVDLERSGANGLVPMRALPDDYYHHDENAHCLRGDRNGLEFSLGQTLQVILREADPLTGGIILSLADQGLSSRTKQGPHQYRGTKKKKVRKAKSRYRSGR